MLSPLGVIFGLVIAFLAAQVWREFDDAQQAVNREASALCSVVVLVGNFPAEPAHQMRGLIRSQIEQIVTEEWRDLALFGDLANRASTGSSGAPCSCWRSVRCSRLRWCTATTARPQRSRWHLRAARSGSARR
jgi:hypothetical protein